MKVLFFIHSLSSGGAERVLSLLATDWSTKGHEVSIAINTHEKSFYTISKDIKIISADIQAKALAGNYKRIQRYKEIMLDVDPDIVISFMTTMCITTTIAAKLAKKPIILSEHTNFFAMKSKVWRSLRRLIYPHSDALCVLTEHDKEKYSFHSNVHVIENPLVLKNEHKNIPREEIILAVGRLHPVKGFDLLIRAFKQLENPKSWRLIILGEGDEKPHLEKLATDLQLKESVSLPGVVLDVEKYYKRASIFVLSSRMEGFPVGLCEAMAYGCPPIAFDCLTGPKEIIQNNENGILVNAGDTEQLTRAIQDLMENPEKREELSIKSKEINNRLSIDKISKKWFQLINNVLNNKT